MTSSASGAQKASQSAAEQKTTSAAPPVNSKITALIKQLRRRSKRPKAENNAKPASAPEEPAPSEPTPDKDPAVEEPTPGISVGVGDDVVEPAPDAGAGNPTAEEPIAPATLARQIQAILSKVPPFYSVLPSGSLRLPKGLSPGGSAQDAAGPPDDTKLISLLSSASAMNGSLSQGRESVWSILERLSYSQGTTDGSSGGESDVETSSVMLCCPLEPDENTEVELGQSEIVSVNAGDVGSRQPPKSLVSLWPFGGNHDKPSPTPPAKVVVWIPSRTKVSLHAAWWGYRLYLPPPVMVVLNHVEVEATQRAAMIAAALSWLVSHLPTSIILPPPLLAIVDVVKGIVPIIGYVSGFIAWSWSTIQSFDKGQGVILSATWLLPIALIPGTWNYVAPAPDNNPAGGSGPATTPSTSPAPPPTNPSPSSPPSAPNK